MNGKLTCSIIRDLLPIYIDNMASKETTTCIEEHISTCNECLKKYKEIDDNKSERYEVISNDVNSVKTLRIKVIIYFSIAMIVGLFFTAIAIFCSYNKLSYNNFEGGTLLFYIVIYLGMYFLPILAMFNAIIFRKISTKQEAIFWANVIITFLAITILSEIIYLFSKFISL